ncbi:MAG: vWA domain-containing protein [Gammaproteobacteria bacterium]
MLKDSRFWLPALAVILIVAALFEPRVVLKRDSYDLVFVLDITQSMNARDYRIDGMPSDRLSFAKHSLKRVISDLPCESKIGLGLFTTKNSFLLFEPLEICEHFAAVIDSLMKIDWRMAWAADSHIARGLYTGLKEVSRMEAEPALIFLTDGDQVPASAKEPGFLKEAGPISGMIVGVGNLQPVPIPKLDTDNMQTGFWQIGDVKGRRAGVIAPTGNYLSALRETSLQRLARIAGLSYHHLETPEKLELALRTANLMHRRDVAYDLRWLLVGSALLLFAAPYLPYRFRR